MSSYVCCLCSRQASSITLVLRGIFALSSTLDFTCIYDIYVLFSIQRVVHTSASLNHPRIFFFHLSEPLHYTLHYDPWTRSDWEEGNSSMPQKKKNKAPPGPSLSPPKRKLDWQQLQKVFSEKAPTFTFSPHTIERTLAECELRYLKDLSEAELQSPVRVLCQIQQVCSHKQY